MGIGFEEIGKGWERFREVYRSHVWHVFAVLTAIECFAILLIPAQTVDAARLLLSPVEPLGIWNLAASVKLIVLLSVVLIVVDLLRQCLWAAARDVVVNGAAPSVSDVLRSALSRAGALFLLSQAVGLCVVALSVLCVLLGLQLSTFPHILITFTFAPAAYGVIALRRPVGQSLLQALTISRQHVAVVFGIQSALALIAIWVSSLFQGANVTPMVGSYLAVSMLAMYRVVHFAGIGTLFFTLEEAGAYDMPDGRQTD